MTLKFTFICKNTLFNINSYAKLLVERNALIRLPEGIGNLTKLSILQVTRNSLTTLPDGILSLTNLNNLDFSHNPMLPPNFKTLPSDSMW